MGLTTFLNDSRPPMRGLLWLGLAETGRVLKRTEATDNGGGNVETYTPAGTASWATSTNVPCRIDALGQGGGDERLAGGRISDLSTHTITMPAGTEVDLDDDFQIEGRGRFEITALRRYTQEFARVIEVTDQTN